LTQKINPFELALREIGALGMLEKNLPKSPDRSRYIERMFAIYAKFLGMSMEGIPREHWKCSRCSSCAFCRSPKYIRLGRTSSQSYTASQESNLGTTKGQGNGDA